MKKDEAKEELIVLLDNVPEEKITELIAQIKYLIQLDSPLLKLKGIVSSERKDGASRHNHYIYREGKN